MVFAIGIGGQSASHALKMQTVRQVGIKRVPTVQSRSKRTQYRVARAMAFQGASTSDATPITSTSLTLTVSLPLQVSRIARSRASPILENNNLILDLYRLRSASTSV